jgi:hypothetical protein
MNSPLKIALCGPGRAGKDEAADWLNLNTRLRYTGSCSSVIAPVAAARLGLSVKEAFRRRHEDRDLWRKLGDEMRAADPAKLARETLRKGDICVGIRSLVEIEAVLRQRLVTIAVWIDRPGIPVDPTLEYDAQMCHVVLSNHGDLPAFHERLRCLAMACGVLKAG